MLYWPRLLIITRIPIYAYCVILAITILGGCESASRNIATSASRGSQLASISSGRFSEIIDLAESSSSHFEGHGDSRGISEQEAIISIAESGIEDQNGIISAANDIHLSLPGVEDQKSAFERILGNITIIVAVIGVAVILWQTGLGLLLKRLIWSIGLLIPKSKRMEVDLDKKILDDSSPATIRESIASKRASDPAYNAAYKRQS